MPLAFSVEAAAVSGSNVKVASVDLRGIGPCRLYVVNSPSASGGHDLTAGSVRLGPDLDNVAVVFDSTTFASLQAGAGAALLIAGPVEALEFFASCALGTTLSIWVDDGVAG